MSRSRTPSLFWALCTITYLVVSVLACAPAVGPSEVSVERTSPEPSSEPAMLEPQSEPMPPEQAPEERASLDAAQGEEPTTPEILAEASPVETEPVSEPTPEKNPPQIIQGGSVDGGWCGKIEIRKTATIPKGKTLTLCPGTHVLVSADQSLVVEGTLLIQGSASQPVRFESPTGTTWTGLFVEGTLSAKHLEVENGVVGLQSGLDSQIEVEHALFNRCNESMRLANGGTLRYVKLLLGPLAVLGGKLTMSDSVIDLDSPAKGRDCTNFRNAEIFLEHVHFTRCHCPLHFNSSTGQVSVSSSIFDQAAYPMMIAKSKGTFSHNHFLTGAQHILDIGGNIDINIAGNYWEGGPPKLGSQGLSQFKGADQYSKTSFSDVGPRP